MLQLGARYYWPEIGRFISQDPIGSGVNWYIYAEDNPLVWIDPEGTDVNWGRVGSFGKCMFMEMYGNDIVALWNWANRRPGPSKGSPCRLLVGTVAPRPIQIGLGKGSKWAPCQGCSGEGITGRLSLSPVARQHRVSRQSDHERHVAGGAQVDQMG